MEILKKDVATIANSEPGGPRVSLSIGFEYYKDGKHTFPRYMILADGKDTGYHFNSEDKADQAIDSLWGKYPTWEMQRN